jgi:hypothetical protein
LISAVKRLFAIAFTLPIATSASACDLAECRAALDVVYQYVSAQRAAYRLEDYSAWLAATDRRVPPRWDSQTVVRFVEYGEVACEAQLCTVHVKYHARGASVPYESFKAGYGFHDVFYKVRVADKALITGNLPGWFVGAETVMHELEAALTRPSDSNTSKLNNILAEVRQAVAN